MTALRNPATGVKRYLYGLVAVNLAIALLIVAFFVYHADVHNENFDRILNYHTATTRAVQSALIEAHRISDTLWNRNSPAGTPPTDTAEYETVGSILADNREIIFLRQQTFADPEFEQPAEAALDAIDAVMRIGTADDPAAGDIAAQRRLLETMQIRLQQLSRLHLQARDRLADDDRQAGLGNPHNLEAAIGLLILFGALAGVGVARNVTAATADREAARRALESTERKFALAFQISPGMTAISEVETSIHVDVNDKWVETMGYSREEAIGKTAYEMGVWADPEQRAMAVALLKKDGRFRDFEGQFRTRHGEVRDFLISAEPFPVGDKAHMLIVAHDITERKSAEQEIKRNEARLNAFITTAPAGLGIVDENFRYMRLNETLAAMNHASIEDHIGKRPSELLPPGPAEFVESVMARTLLHGESIINEEGSAENPDGTTDHWVFSQFPIPGNEPGRTALGAIVIDVTELKKAQAELQKLNAELEQRVEERTAELRAAQEELVRRERLATLGQLTATVSHELRNPLGAIRTSLYVIGMRLSEKDEGTSEALRRIDRSITRCDHIVDELLDFTRIRDLTYNPLEFDAWLKDVVGEQSIPKDIELQMELNAGDIRVMADSERLRRALVNIIENACQAMTAGSKNQTAKLLSISSRVRNDRVEVVVEDTGPGISRELLEKIFEPLYSTKNFGVGLGLPVVRQIMHQHQGEVEVTNRKDGGASFVLWLPLVPAAELARTD